MPLINNTTLLWGDDLKKELKPGTHLKIAASCFSIYAFEALKEELKNIKSLEFIFTKPTFTPGEATKQKNREWKEFFISKTNREQDLYGSEFEIHLRNKLTQKSIAKECASWLRAKATFKSNTTKSDMNQFCCVEGSNEVIYNPIEGFTAVNLGYQPNNDFPKFITKINEAPATKEYIKIFDEIWDDSDRLENVTETICNHIASIYQENSPERIYFITLYNIFSEFLEDISEDNLPNEKTGYKDSVIWNKLFNFQRDAATGIINKLERFNGCILADSVGLGKTFTALAVIKYYELRNKSVLVLCPKKLEDNWQTYRNNYKTNTLVQDRLNYDLLFHTDLSRTRGYSAGTDLTKINWENYDLVVIDESHNFRNSGRSLRDRETRYERLMRTVIQAGVQTKVLMLSATPVNNRFNDLKNQLALAYEGDSTRFQQQLSIHKPIDEIFRQAQSAFNTWANLPPKERTAQAILDALDFDFFELLDSVTIARSRKHIETYYNTKDIGDFPTRLTPLSYSPPLTGLSNVISINEIYRHLSEIKQSVYAPLAYVQPSRLQKYEDRYGTATNSAPLSQRGREQGLQSLMRTNLLKRLESSVYSFRETLNNLKKRVGKTIENIDQFNKSKQKTFATELDSYEESIIEEYDDFDDLVYSTEGKVQIDFEDIDLVSWRKDLEEDHTLIELLHEEMEKITPEDDSKLKHLKEKVLSKINNPINPGNKKLLIFTAFADTAEYLYKNISPELKSAQINSAKISGSDSIQNTLKSGYDFSKVLTFFSPKSKEKELLFPDEPGEIDVLIATDCISEGQNLQDCDYVINYDIHWNPVRIIQRFGRIDRIGSTNSSIQLVNYWPDITLDEYINLKERVENRMVIADVTATADDNILSPQTNDISYRKEQLKRLKDEVIELEDVKTGISITDLGLNDFRMDLLNYMKENEGVELAPKGMHATVLENPEIGLIPGTIYVLRNRNEGINIEHHNRLHPYYLVYVTKDGSILTKHTQPKILLDLFRSCCRNVDKPVSQAFEKFNIETQDGKDMHGYSELLDRAIESIIQVKEDQDLDRLFNDRTATLGLEKIRDLNDFELISFLVIKEK